MVQTILTIDGMMCNMCESHINDAVRAACKVKSVKSSHKSGKTEILSPEPLDTDALKAAIEKTGYRVLSVDTKPYEKKRFSLFGR